MQPNNRMQRTALRAAAEPGSGCVAVVTLAGQAFIEERTLEGIRAAQRAFEDSAQFARLARWHGARARWVLDAWTQVWLSPAFRPWSLASELARLTGRVLAVQGENDEYGTLEQIRGIARAAPQTELLALPDCGHSPHRDQPQALIDAVRRFAHPG